MLIRIGKNGRSRLVQATIHKSPDARSARPNGYVGLRLDDQEDGSAPVFWLDLHTKDVARICSLLRERGADMGELADWGDALRKREGQKT